MQSLEDILEGIQRATDRGEVAWDAAPHEAFSTELSNYSVNIRTWFDENNEITGLTADLRDKHGKVLDEITADQYSPKHASLAELFNAARRSAFKVGDAISEIQKDLKSRGKRIG
jgi:hypothetical protein